MKVIVVHPGKQHSFELSKALIKKGVLDRYITSVYNKPKSFTRILLKFVKGNLYKKINGRKSSSIPDESVKQYNELGVIFTLFLNKFPRIQKIAENWNFYIESSFYKKTMKFIKNNRPDCVVIYNGYANKHIDIIKNLGVVKIMDMSIAKRDYIQQILQHEIDETGLSEIKDMHFSYWDEKMLMNDSQGCNGVDFFLVPSKFVKDSLLQSGIHESKIKMVPYGVNIQQFNLIENKKISGNLKLLFVGSITYRKGIHRLLNVIQKMPNVEVYLAGTYDKSSKIYLNYKDYENIHFLGFITRDILNDLYNECDVFVLPSFCEGMAMVGLEAMASGLPIICTSYSGVNDVVEDGVNGFVYTANQEDELKKHIIWFIENRNQLKRLSHNARNTALNYSWDQYHTRVADAIEVCIKESKN
jgi:glycosyltransferase involved in cell wall biosynthesis